MAVCIVIVMSWANIHNKEKLQEDIILFLSLDDFKLEGEYSNQSMFDVYILERFQGEISSASPADFNDDGYVDFAVVCLLNFSSIYIFYNIGNFEFTREQIYNYGDDINDLVSGDFDNDGDIDLVFTSCENIMVNNTSFRINGTVNILFNEGNNDFGDRCLISKRSTGIIRDSEGRINPRVTSADYDMDGDLDLLVGDNSGKVEFYVNDGKGNFTTKGVIYDFGSLSWGLASADFDMDGDIDFVVAVTEKEDTSIGHIYLQCNQIIDSEDLSCFKSEFGEIIADNSFFLAVASLSTLDYDNDGDKDILVGTSILLYLIDKDGGSYVSFVVGHTDEDETGWEILQRVGFAVADYNNDGWDDFIFGASRGIVRLFINNYQVNSV